MKKLTVLAAVALAFVIAAPVSAGDKDPVTGPEFERWVAAQDTALQHELEELFPEILGYVVAGPLRSGLYTGRTGDNLHEIHRVMCVTPEVQQRALLILERNDAMSSDKPPVPIGRYGGGVLSGTLLEVSMGGRDFPLLVLTHQANRWLIWRWRFSRLHGVAVASMPFWNYSGAVAAYLDSVDAAITSPVPSASSVMRVWNEIDQGVPPNPEAYGLPAEAGFLPPRPEYVIQGYQNYKDYLHEHEDIETWFADGIIAFVPTDSLLGILKRDARPAAWPNKESQLLQYEFVKYFSRSGHLYEIKTLTHDVLSTLKPGEYFYAVGLNGRIRFGFETPREEVERIERETGRKVPRANHSFLFPGEPVLTAGAFFVEAGEAGAAGTEPGIVEVNTHSGHYFYSNVTSTIREDISRRSDEYLLTIGHFFVSLDREGISYSGILVSKM